MLKLLVVMFISQGRGLLSFGKLLQDLAWIEPAASRFLDWVHSLRRLALVCLAGIILGLACLNANSQTGSTPAATPVFSLASGAYSTAQTVTITDTTSGATIYYTTDGSAPTTSSTQYIGAITVSSNETLEAIAVVNSYTNSGTTIANYVIAPRGGWIDDFQSYALGSFPSANWTPSGNNGTQIVSSPVIRSSRSAQLYGQVGACWAALIHRQLSVSPPYTVEFYAYNGTESLSGCHPTRAGAGLNTQPTWTSPGRTLANFSSDGHFLDGNNTQGPQFPLQTWVKVRIAYEITNTATVQLTYWLNDQYFESINVAANSYEAQLDYLSLDSGEGTSYFDNVSVTAGTDTLLPYTSYFHGTEVLSWVPPAVSGVPVSANLALSGPVAQTLGSGLRPTSSMSWDTTTVPDGNYQLTLTFLDASGNVLTYVTKNVLVNNSVVWHSGTLTSSQTWSSSAVHAIDANLIIPSGVTLTIQPGTIVKVVPGVGITVQSGGILNALGTSRQPIIFTSIDDSSVGGDTTLNGGADVPSSAEWDGITVQGTGQFNTNSNTELLYWQAVETGALTANETWSGSRVYQVTGNVTVPSGVTLTIQPGSIVKFGANTGITVQAGGTLIANGTVAQPIYFTSIKDDSVGGDTNGDGSATSPAAGDWQSIVINGATASFDHVQMSYGGGPVSSSNVLGMIQSTGSSKVTISNSNITNSFWDGILTGYPNGGDVVTVSSSVIDGVEGRGVNAWPASTVHVVNDTFDNDGVGVFVHGGTVDIANSIVTNTKGTSGWAAVQVCCGGDLASVRYSDVWANASGVANYGGTSDPTGTNGNISANPVFVNEAQGSYRLNYGSPAIDAADGMVANYSLTDIMGDPRYNDPEVAQKKGIADANGNYPDMGAYEFVQNAVSNIDFTVNSVTGPASALAGNQVQVTWTVTNIGTGTAVGPWHDSVYLVRDPDTNPVELFAVQVLVGSGVVMGPGASYTNTATIRVPGSTVGSHRWEVKTNTAGDIFEGQNTSNNTGRSLSFVDPDLPQLVVNGPGLTNSFAAAGQSWWYKLIPGAGNTVGANLKLTGNSGSVQLFVGQGYVPTPQQFDIEQQQWNSPSVSAEIPNTSTQIYYVTAYAQTLPSTPAPFTISAASQQFSLTSVQPSSIVNNGNATVEFIGAELTANATYQIVGANAAAYSASSVYAADSAHVYATFAASRLATGTYSVQVTEIGSTLSLKNAITVTAAPAQPVTSGQIAYDIQVPDAVRAGYGGVVTINYQNTGSDDVVAPLMMLTTTGASTHFMADLSGYVVSPNYQTLYTTMVGQGQFLGINQTGGPVGVLPAGAEGSVSLSFTAGTGNNVQFSLYTVDDPTAPIDWASASSSMQPSWVSADAWAPIFANFTAAVGTTWGTYNAALANDSTYLGQLGVQEYRVSQLQSFELMKAGLNTISQRYFLGAFGRGTSHPFDIWAETMGSGYLFQYPNGAVRAFVANPSNPGQFIGGIGDYATLSYNSSDMSVLLTEKNGTVYHFLRDSNNGHVLFDYIQDLNGNRITAKYTNGLVTSATSSTGDTLTFTYDGNGRITQATDPVGRATTYSYDASDQHLLSIANASGTIGMAYITGQGAAQEHALESVTWQDGTHTYYGYDAQGRLTNVHKDGGAQQITLAYATTGAITLTDALGNASQLSLDANGSVAQFADPLGNLTQMLYDPEEKLIRTIGPDGSATSLTYDSNGNPTGERDPLGNQLATQFAPNGDLLGLTDALGDATQYGYDSHYNATGITYPDTRVVQAAYDSRGNITSFTNRRGQQITYAYNSNNLLTQKTRSNGATVNYTYDSHRNLQSVLDSSGTTNLSYDSADRLLQVTYPTGRFVKYTYDSGGRRSSLSDQTGYTVNYAYDSVGRLSQLTSGSGSLIASYTYDSDGRLSQKTLGNGAYTTYAYDAAGNVLHLINYSSQGVINSRFVYTYDATGRKIAATTLNGAWQYSYDADGQLTGVTPPSNSAVQYTYDAAGNRITTVSGAASTNYSVNNLNQYTSVGGLAYSYDNDGNLISKQTSSGTWTYTYDDESRLLIASGPGGSWVYQYDSFGNRISSVNGSTTTQYLVDPTGIGSVEAEFDGTGKLVSHFANGLGLESSAPASGNADFYQFDDSGNTATVTGTGGTVADAYSFLPFGEKVKNNVTVSSSFTYVGQFGVADDGNGLYYMRARYYDPSTGRLVNEDPIGLRGGTNMYTYADNRPDDLVDPEGLYSFTLQLPSEVVPWFGLRTTLSFGDNGTWGLGAGFGFCLTGCGPSLTYNPFGQPGQGGSVVVTGNPGSGMPGWSATCNQSGCQTNPVLPVIGGENPGITVSPTWSWTFLWPFGSDQGSYSQNPFNGPPTPDELCLLGGSCTLPGPLTLTTGDTIQNAHSADPNGKITTGYGNQGFIPPDATITYTIYFENQSSATAPAAEVVVTDPLDSNLDPSTVQFSQMGFNNVALNLPGGLQSYTTQASVSTSPYPVTVSASLNPGTATLTWTMQSIDPTTGAAPADPLAGFLPPDNSSQQGEGYVTFTVKPKSGLANGTAINNQASIVFDRNAAISTNKVTNTIDSVYPTSSVSPLPAITYTASFPVSWLGTDPAGAGIATYDIYFSTDSGPYTNWQSATTSTSATFNGALGHTYSFYSMATDNVGHRQQTPGPVQSTATQASSTISSFTLSPATVTSGGTVTLAIQLAAAAPSGGAVVSLSSSNATLVPVPTSLTISTGRSSASLPIQVGSVASPTMVTVTGTLNGASQQAQVTVNPIIKTSPAVIVTPASSSVTTMQSLQVTVTVSGGSGSPTPTGTITLTSGNYTSSVATLSSGSATITIPAGSLAVGNDTLTASYSGDSNYGAATGTASVIVIAPGFTLSASPASLSVAQGGTGTSTITVTDVGGFTGGVTLAASGLPSGVTASFAAGSAAGTQVLTVTANTSATTTSSPVTVTITGTSGSLTATTSVSLSITPEPSFTAGPGGTTSMTVTPGLTTGNTGTISLVGTNGFSGTVNLTCAVTTSMTSVNDTPTCSLNPTSVAISGTTAQTSTLTVTTTAATSAENRMKGLFWPPAGGAALALVAFLTLPMRRRNWSAILGLFVLLVSLWAIGCGGSSNGGGGGGGGGNSGTTPGAYTITVTGTSGSVSATVGTVALTVQ